LRIYANKYVYLVHIFISWHKARIYELSPVTVSLFTVHETYIMFNYLSLLINKMKQHTEFEAFFSGIYFAFYVKLLNRAGVLND